MITDKLHRLTNSSTSLAFAVNPKLLSASTREPVLPIFWQDNYFSLLPGEKRTIKMQVDASLVKDEKLLFKLDGWNLREIQQQELLVP
jgi:exo-1,4-beta-D-glucosaminidase